MERETLVAQDAESVMAGIAELEFERAFLHIDLTIVIPAKQGLVPGTVRSSGAIRVVTGMAIGTGHHHVFKI